MKWHEKCPLPKECEICQEQDCYNCDTAGERWYISREDELKVIRKGLLKAIQRMNKQVEEIDRELNSFIKL